MRARIIHISDPHFGTTTPEKIAALTEVLINLNPDLVVLSGDVTQRAHHSQFTEAKQFCDGLQPLKILAVPGNHDIPLFNLPARFLSPYHGFKKHFGFPVNTNCIVKGIEVMGLNTTHPKRHVQGELYTKEHKILKQFSASAAVRIVALHHPLDCAKQVDEKNLLVNAAETIENLSAAKIDIILSGHIHDPLVRLTNTRYPATVRPAVVSVAGTCLSSRTRAGAPNSFHVLEIDSTTEQIDLSIIRYDMNSNFKFASVGTTVFRRAGPDHWQSLST